MERGLKKVAFCKFKTTWISNKRDYVKEGAIYRGLEGLQLSLRGLYIIASIDCGVWYLDDDDDKVQYWP